MGKPVGSYGHLFKTSIHCPQILYGLCPCLGLGGIIRAHSQGFSQYTESLFKICVTDQHDTHSERSRSQPQQPDPQGEATLVAARHVYHDVSDSSRPRRGTYCENLRDRTMPTDQRSPSARRRLLDAADFPEVSSGIAAEDEKPND